MKPENINNFLTKATFAPLLFETLDRISLTNAIKNEFPVYGLYSLDPNAVDYAKCVKNYLENVVDFLNFLTRVTGNKEILDLAENLIRTLKPLFEEKGINLQSTLNVLREVKLEVSESPIAYCAEELQLVKKYLGESIIIIFIVIVFSGFTALLFNYSETIVYFHRINLSGHF